MSHRNRLKTIFANSFLKDVISLSIGTLAGRAITMVALPMLTRIYSPADFALMASFMAVVSLISVASCMRYEIAIPLAESKDDADNLLIASLISLLTVVLLTSVLVLFYSSQISDLIKRPEVRKFLWLIPFGITTTGFYAITQNWATRERKFAEISRTRITQALFGSLTSLLLGLMGFSPVGLLLGNLINTSAGGIKLAISLGKNEISRLKNITSVSLKEVVYKYKKFPLYSNPESLFNIGGTQVPIILIAMHAGAEAGFLALAMQLVVIPTRLLGGAISQVYTSRAPQAFKENQLKELTQSILGKQFKIGSIFFTLIAIVMPLIVPYIFGEKWSRSGELMIWLAPSMLMQFTASPVSMALHVTGKQSVAMILNILGFVLRIGGVVVAIYAVPYLIVEIFASANFLFYACYLFFVNKAVCHN